MLVLVSKFEKKCLYKPMHIFPFPVYPLLQVHLYFPGSVSVHVAYLWQSSFPVPHILLSNHRIVLIKEKNNITGLDDWYTYNIAGYAKIIVSLYIVINLYKSFHLQHIHLCRYIHSSRDQYQRTCQTDYNPLLPNHIF